MVGRVKHAIGLRSRGVLHTSYHNAMLMKIKICGLTSVADALAAAEAGADWIGLNFHPGSLRRVEINVARAIVETLPKSCEPVGLFVDRPAVEVAALAEWLNLRIVQLHGSEPVEDLPYYAGFRVVRAFRIADEASLSVMRDYADRAALSGHPLHAVLVDAHVAGKLGGTGQTISVDLLDLIAGMAPLLPRLVLAGGLTPANVAERIARVRPWMVDVAGGVESAPGRKNPDLVAAFVQAARPPAKNSEKIR
jgi:phosphoribosylanthranilate isomerase